jgi:hypothetical protein
MDGTVIAIRLAERWWPSRVSERPFAVPSPPNLAMNRSKYEGRAFYQRVWVRIV